MKTTYEMDFSFGIITYNSSKYILELLESIKYQITRYGHEKRIQIVIGDDCSKDQTVFFVKKWLECNEYLFQEILIIENKDNKGTVNNYNNVIHQIKSKYFHIIAGDDLYNYYNILNYIEGTKRFDIVTTFPIGVLENGDLFIDKNRLLRRINDIKNQPYTSKKLVGKESYGSLLHSPSTFFKKEMYTDEVERFVSMFVLFEDDPMWIKFLQKTNLVFFDTKPVIMYRYHSKSVCHSNTFKDAFKRDKKKLYEYCLTCDISLKYRLYVKIKLKELKRGETRVLSNSVRFLEIVWLKITNANSRRYIKELNQIKYTEKHTRKYYMYIKNEVSKFKHKEGF